MKTPGFVAMLSLAIISSLAARAQVPDAGPGHCVANCGSAPSPRSSPTTYYDPNAAAAAAAAAEAERQRQLEADRQRQREAEEQRLRDEEKAKRDKEEFERRKQEALSGMKDIDGGEPGLKGVNDNLGLKDAGDTSGGPGLKEIERTAPPAWDAQITNPQIAKIAHGLDAIQVPPPLPRNEASLSWKQLYLNNSAMLNASDHVLDFWELTGTLGEAASLHCRLILIAGRTLIAGEDGAYVHLVKQDQVYENALRYLKDPVKSRQFTHLVQALKEKTPLPASADADMVRAARAILDPKLGSSGMRIAWDSMLSPEARAAMVRKASLEIGSELVSEGTQGLFYDLTKRKELYTAARLERDEARTMLKEPGNSLSDIDQLRKVVDHANAVFDDLYRLQSVVPTVASSAVGDATGELVNIYVAGDKRTSEEK